MVVTIVVLLILAGISISLVVGDNGLIRKSKDAKKQYEEAQANELAMTDEAGDLIDETVTGNLKGTKETKPYLPSGDYTKVPGTSLDNGLVIADKKGNEYVWVEVPRNAEVVYKTAGLNITEFSATELASIKTDLVNYAKDYRKSGWDDTWYSGCGIADSGTYTDKYNKMLKSVYQNGGFWIGRYEIGIDENTTTNHTPVIKANKIPYTYITCSQAESLAETFAPSGYTSSLLFGLQWDLVLKHLETKGTNPGTSATSLQDAIKSNSTDVAMMCKLGFDIKLADMSKDDETYCRTAVQNYNRLKPVVLEGDMYRLVSPYGSNHTSTMYVGKDKDKAVVFAFDIHPRYAEKTLPVRLQGLDADKMYRVKEINLMPGANSSLSGNGEVFSGEFLMNVGLNLFTTQQLNSRVVEVVAE